MKFSVCNEFFEGWKLDEVFKYSAELGYDGVEIAHFTICDSVTEVSKTERERIRQSAEKAGVFESTGFELHVLNVSCPDW